MQPMNPDTKPCFFKVSGERRAVVRKRKIKWKIGTKRGKGRQTERNKESREYDI